MRSKALCALLSVTAATATISLETSQAEAAEWIIAKPQDGAGRAHQLDIVGILNPRSGGFTILPGLIYGIPIVPDGFIPSLNDSFYLELGGFLGATFATGGPFVSLTPVGGVRWNFHLVPEWTVFGAIRGGYSIFLNDNVAFNSSIYIDGTAGAHWHFADALALRLEAIGGRYGGSLLVGLSIQL